MPPLPPGIAQDAGSPEKYHGVQHDAATAGTPPPNVTNAAQARQFLRGAMRDASMAADNAAAQNPRSGSTSLGVVVTPDGSITHAHIGDSPLIAYTVNRNGDVTGVHVLNKLDNPIPYSTNVIGSNTGSEAYQKLLADDGRKGQFEGTNKIGDLATRPGDRVVLVAASDGVLDAVGNAPENLDWADAHKYIQDRVQQVAEAYAPAISAEMKRGGTPQGLADAMIARSTALGPANRRDNSSAVAMVVDPADLPRQPVAMLIADGNGPNGKAVSTAIKNSIEQKISVSPAPVVAQPVEPARPQPTAADRARIENVQVDYGDGKMTPAVRTVPGAFNHDELMQLQQKMGGDQYAQVRTSASGGEYLAAHPESQNNLAGNLTTFPDAPAVHPAPAKPEAPKPTSQADTYWTPERIAERQEQVRRANNRLDAALGRRSDGEPRTIQLPPTPSESQATSRPRVSGPTPEQQSIPRDSWDPQRAAVREALATGKVTIDGDSLRLIGDKASIKALESKMGAVNGVAVKGRAGTWALVPNSDDELSGPRMKRVLDSIREEAAQPSNGQMQRQQQQQQQQQQARAQASPEQIGLQQGQMAAADQSVTTLPTSGSSPSSPQVAPASTAASAAPADSASLPNMPTNTQQRVTSRQAASPTPVDGTLALKPDIQPAPVAAQPVSRNAPIDISTGQPLVNPTPAAVTPPAPVPQTNNPPIAIDTGQPVVSGTAGAPAALPTAPPPAEATAIVLASSTGAAAAQPPPTVAGQPVPLTGQFQAAAANPPAPAPAVPVPQGEILPPQKPTAAASVTSPTTVNAPQPVPATNRAALPAAAGGVAGAYMVDEAGRVIHGDVLPPEHTAPAASVPREPVTIDAPHAGSTGFMGKVGGAAGHGLAVMGVVEGTTGAYQSFKQGDTAGGLLNSANAALNLANLSSLSSTASKGTSE